MLMEIQFWRRTLFILIALICTLAAAVGALAAKYVTHMEQIEKLNLELSIQEAAAESVQRLYNIPPQSARLLTFTVFRHARHARIDPYTVLGAMRIESNFDRHAISSRQAVGLLQIRPLWLPELGLKSWTDLHDIETNVRGGIYIMRQYRRLAGEHWLTAYNRGITTVTADLRHGRNPDNGYHGAVMREAERIRGVSL